MAPDKSKNATRPIESYEHRHKERLNNPPVGLVTPQTDPDAGQKKKTYAYDPHLIRTNQGDSFDDLREGHA